MDERTLEALNRRRIDRRKRRVRIWRGVERRLGDRRNGIAAGLVIAASLAAPKPVQAKGHPGLSTNRQRTVASRQIDPGVGRIVLAGDTIGALTTTTPGRKGHRADYDQIIAQHAALHDVRPELVRAVIQAESNFNPFALSGAGAMGLMQLMPATAAELGVTNPFDPFENIRGGTKYLRQLLTRYHGNETLAIAAYNAGPGAVEKHGLRVPPFRETQQYVARILASLGADRPTASVRHAVAATPAASKVIYKITEMIEGRAVPRYSSTKPASGPFEILKRG